MSDSPPTSDATPASTPLHVNVSNRQTGEVISVVPLSASGLTVGSAPGNRIQLEGAAIARHHLLIRRQETQVSVRVLVSKHETAMDSTRLPPNRIYPWNFAQTIQIGDYILRLSQTPEATASRPQTPIKQPTPAPATQGADDPIAIELAPADEKLHIQPGKPVDVTIRLRNRTPVDQKVNLFLTGLDPEDYTFKPVNGNAETKDDTSEPFIVDIAAGSSSECCLHVRVPRKPERVAGQRTIALEARSPETQGRVG